MNSSHFPIETVNESKLTKSVQLTNIPESIKSSDLNTFCSLFGKVRDIKYSATTSNTVATIQFEDTCFLDKGFYESTYNGYSAVNKFQENYQNGRFLSDLLNVFRSGTWNKSHVETEMTIRCSNKTDNSVEKELGFLICTFCYACADFVCERCESPYCSTRCQQLDWLSHKRMCFFPNRKSTKKELKRSIRFYDSFKA